jgi:chromate transporter
MQHESKLAIFLMFLRFGFFAWGGPVAQINMLREELVEQKKWINKDKFKHVLAVYQALPGPEAHELCVYFGMIRAGRIGAFLAGLGFMLPGFFLMLLLAWVYTLYGASTLLPLFICITPVVAALIVRATHRIGVHILDSKSLIIASFTSFILSALQINFLLVFTTCAIWQMLQTKNKPYYATIFGLITIAISLWLTQSSQNIPIFYSLGEKPGLFIEGLKAGLLSFGGAYTAIPFLHNSMVEIYPNITEQSFLDGIALGNIIPAPLVIFGTYLGFIAGGFWGALFITIGIFLPAFAFTIFGHKQLEKIIGNPILHGLLDGISAAVVGLLAITTIQIFLNSVTGPMQITIFTIALTILYIWKWIWSVPLMLLTCGILGYIINL